MNEPPNLEPSAMEALLSEVDPAIAPRLADLFGAMRAEYASVPPTAGPELSALMRVGRPTRESARIRRRFEEKRASMLAKIGGAVAVLIAATGGLAAAQALPGPLQDAISHLGLPAPTKPTFDPHSSPDSTTSDPTSTSSTIAPTPTTTGTSSDHGDVVSGIARDHSTTGCEHGVAVSEAASDGRAQPGASNPSTGTSKDGSCDSPTTTVAGVSPTTTDLGRGHDDSAPPTSTPQHGGGNPIEGHGGGTNHGNAGS
jgi:hypothetical protein